MVSHGTVTGAFKVKTSKSKLACEKVTRYISMCRELISDAILAACKLIKNTKYEVPTNIISVLYLVYVFADLVTSQRGW